MKRHRRSVRDEAGATSAEYAIMAALIAGVVIAAVAALGLTTGGLFCNVTDGWSAVDGTVQSATSCNN